ncbi:MAG: hypothetical protein U0271_34740 [Polyangiaceae bacterium]
MGTKGICTCRPVAHRARGKTGIIRGLGARTFILLLALPACDGSWTQAGLDRRSQNCIEEALRRNPDPSLLPGVAAALEAHCGEGNPADCSALGVMYELGMERPHDAAKAKLLYARGCEAGNQRACVNLDRLALAGSQTPEIKQAARRVFEEACNHDEATGCYELGLLEATGELATSALERACSLQLGRACMRLAELQNHDAELTAMACRFGHLPACSAMMAPAPADTLGPSIAHGSDR